MNNNLYPILNVHNIVSPNYGTRCAEAKIDMLVLHYTVMQTISSALERLCDPQSNVSTHYCIDEDGNIFSLVHEQNRAWHAGKSFWRGNTDINSRSIGIEIANPGHQFGYRPFPEKQMTAIIKLSRNILSRFCIPARNVVGHSDIAPDRKLDPGELFDWQRLATAGVGVWPEPKPPPKQNLVSMLSEYGYDRKSENIIAAFQRHFRPAAITGEADEECYQIAAGLIELATKD